MKKTYIFEIAEFTMSLCVDIDVKIEKAFQVFLSKKKPDIKITFCGVDQIPNIRSENLVTESNVRFSEFMVEGKYVRLLHRYDGTQRYAMLQQIEPKQWLCQYLHRSAFAFSCMTECFEHIAFERILLEKQAMILHASLIKTYIQQKEVGILFTGVSGIGKSTQAELWKTYEGATVLNGDRTILRKKESCWYGYGSPYAGSSNIYRNEGVPICAVVVLEKSDTNECMRLRVQEAFKKIYAGLTVNTWNPEFVEQVIECNIDFCMTVPVYFLKCRAEKEAVEILKKNLEQL